MPIVPSLTTFLKQIKNNYYLGELTKYKVIVKNEHSFDDSFDIGMLLLGNEISFWGVGL